MPTGPATKLFYSVAGRTVLVNAYDDWSSSSVPQLFAGWFLDPLPDHSTLTPDVTINVRCGVVSPPVPEGLSHFEVTHEGTCYSDEETYFIAFGQSLIRFGPGKNREVSLWVDQPYDFSASIVTQLLSHALSPALRRSEIFEIHSAAVIPPGRSDSILIAGPSGSGKSTLTSQLARSGWGYLSDDILLLTEHDQKIQVQAFRRFFALTADTMAAANLPRANNERNHDKERVSPQEHFQQAPVQLASAATIVFPTLVEADESSVKSLSSAESMRRLLRLCPWSSYDKPTSATHLRILGLLANTTSAFELLAGRDVFRDPKTAAQVVHSLVDKLALTR